MLPSSFFDEGLVPSALRILKNDHFKYCSRYRLPFYGPTGAIVFVECMTRILIKKLVVPLLQYCMGHLAKPMKPTGSVDNFGEIVVTVSACSYFVTTKNPPFLIRVILMQSL